MDNEIIRISFYEDEDDELLYINLPSQPFVVGQKIYLSVDNNDKNKWDVMDLPKMQFEIVDIEHEVRLSYFVKVRQYVNVLVRVKRLIN